MPLPTDETIAAQQWAELLDGVSKIVDTLDGIRDAVTAYVTGSAGESARLAGPTGIDTIAAASAALQWAREHRQLTVTLSIDQAAHLLALAVPDERGA